MPASSHTTAPQAKVAAKIAIAIPHASSAGASGRRPAYISAATQSATLNVTPQGSTTSVSGFPETVNLTPTSAGCISTLASTECTIQLALNAGSYDVTVTTYDQTGGAGNQLSAAQSVPLTIAAGELNLISLTLGGVPASVEIFPQSSTLTGNATVGFALTANATAAALVLAVDADDNVIVGAGAPTITVTNGAPGQLTVTSPTTTSPNEITLTGNPANTTIPNVTLTLTATPPVASGANAVTLIVDVAPLLPAHLFVLNQGTSTLGPDGLVCSGGGVLAYDQLGNLVSLTGAFAGTASECRRSIAYDSVNHWLYVSSTAAPIQAYDLNGNLQTISGAFNGTTGASGIAFDASNDLFYVATGESVSVYDQSGNQETVSGTFANVEFPTAIAYDSANGLLYVISGGGTINVYDQNGNQQTVSGTFPNLNLPIAIAYDPANGWLYVINDGNHTITVYDQNGNQQTVSGTFPNLELPIAIAYEPHNGFLYVAGSSPTTTPVTVYDQNGNQQTVSGSFSGITPGGAIGIVAIP